MCEFLDKMWIFAPVCRKYRSLKSTSGSLPDCLDLSSALATLALLTYLRTLPIMALIKSLQFDAIPFVFAVDGALGFMVIAIESRGDVLAKPVLAKKQVLQVGTDIVVLAVLELPHR